MLDILLDHDLGTRIFSVGAPAEKEGIYDLLSNPAATIRGMKSFPISKEVPRMYVINKVVDGENLEGPVANNKHSARRLKRISGIGDWVIVTREH